MSREERKQRRALALIFTIVVGCFILISVFLVGVTAYLLIYFKILTDSGQQEITATSAILIVVGATFIVGLIMTWFLGKIPLKPVNQLVGHIKSLAKGDFKVRLKFGKILSNQPSMRELTDSFNAMAEELDHTQMLRKDFINNFSHEFKTPIVSIAGFAKLLKRGNLTEKQQKEYLDIIEKESLRLSTMATNVLNLTKIENQTILTDVAQFNLSEQIRSCILLLEGKWAPKEISFDIDFGEYTILANEELLKEVWINLLDNAVKFSDAGGIVELSIREEQERLFISVLNRGSEISKEKQKRIFNKFYQADESHATEGNGIGLALVKGIVELHKGKVKVNSENNTTIFTVELPRRAS